MGNAKDQKKTNFLPKPPSKCQPTAEQTANGHPNDSVPDESIPNLSPTNPMIILTSFEGGTRKYQARGQIHARACEGMYLTSLTGSLLANQMPLFQALLSMPGLVKPYTKPVNKGD